MNYVRLLKMATLDLLKENKVYPPFLQDLYKVLERADEINTKLVGSCKKKVSH